MAIRENRGSYPLSSFVITDLLFPNISRVGRIVATWWRSGTPASTRKISPLTPQDTQYNITIIPVIIILTITINSIYCKYNTAAGEMKTALETDELRNKTII